MTGTYDLTGQPWGRAGKSIIGRGEAAISGSVLLNKRQINDPSGALSPSAFPTDHGVALRADSNFSEFYLNSTRKPSIYVNVFLAILVTAIPPLRYFLFGLPFFPTALSGGLEWGVMVPCCLAVAWLRKTSLPLDSIQRWTPILSGLSFSAMQADAVIWQQNGIPIPHEYSGLVFVGVVSVLGSSTRVMLTLSVLFLGLSLASFGYLSGRWNNEVWFHLYFDGVAIAIAALNARAMRHEARLSWALKSRLNELAFRDPLTGLANRHFLRERVIEIFSLAQRDRRSLGLAVIDLDRFKGLNDSHGHIAGDQALKTVAQLLRTCADRPGDLAARIGGDEFLLVWSEARLADCEDHGRRMLALVEGAQIQNAASANGYLGLSIGIVCGIPGPSQGFEVFRRRADEELYRVKNHQVPRSLQVCEIEPIA